MIRGEPIVTAARTTRGLDARSVAATASLCLPFAAILAVLELLRPASASQRLAADPLVQLLEPVGGVWSIVAAAAIVAAAWWRRGRPERADARWAAMGMAVAALLTIAVRLVVGPHLPSFVPPEESAAPGATLGLAAGLVEEVVFRLVLLPGVFLATRDRLGPRASAALAVAVTATLFSLSHELGPAGGDFEPRFLVTRFLFPGVVMSVVALRVSLPFIVFAHCTAHLLIPPLFPG